MPTKAPSEPMIASQPCRTAASTPILTGASPITARRASSGCARNSSKHGTETTRAAMPFAASSFCASTAIATSEPVAKIVTWALPSAGEIS